MGLPPALDFSGKRVVVTGAASGIGAATADLFGELGADVVGLDVADGSLDLRSPEGIDAAVTALAGTPIWALVNCAGVPQTAGGSTVMTVNFLGTRYLTEALVPQIVAGGAVATVASRAGQGWPSTSASSASWWAPRPSTTAWRGSWPRSGPWTTRTSSRRRR